MTKRLIDDIDGMLDDIRETYSNHSKQELIDIIMDLNHNEQDENDLIEDWQQFCMGEIIDSETEKRNVQIDMALSFAKGK
jgi:hypothetical protein